MKKLMYLMITVAVMTGTACEKENEGNDCNLPSTSVPSNVVGDWVNGYTSFTQVVDAYNGRVLGSTWQSGRYLSLKNNGKNAVMYIMGGSQFSEFATKVEGSVTIDEASGIMRFHVCSAYYKGWENGRLKVDRPATASERDQLSDNLQFYYDFEASGNTTWLQLVFLSTPQGSPTSFRKIN